MEENGFGVYLKRKMHERGMTGRELAQHVGVSDSAVSRWTSGDQTPSDKIIVKIAWVLEEDPLPLMKRAGKLPGIDVEPTPMPPPQVDRDDFEKTVVAKISGLSRKSRTRLMEAYDEIISIEESR